MNRFKAAYLALRNPMLVTDGVVVQTLAKKLDGTFAIIQSQESKLQVFPINHAQRSLIRNLIPKLPLLK